MGKLTYDYSFLMADAVGLEAGLEPSEMEALAPQLDTCRADLVGGGAPFASLPDNAEAVNAVLAYRDSVHASITDFVVLGIGGSSLGGRAVVDALVDPYNPGILRNGRKGRRIHFPDNVDPEGFAALLRGLDPARTLFNAVSKSGGTVETIAQLMIVLERLSTAIGPEEARRRLVVTTDPHKGLLRRFASEHSLHSFEVPPEIGGRFSVLTPVGLLPAAMAGADVRALMAGAAEAARCAGNCPVLECPAFLLASTMYLMDTARGRGTQVFMPYRDALSAFAQWVQQLWGESLGKRRGAECVGPTPIVARGVTDQHSQLQLYMEGPQDKVVVFIEAEKAREDLTIPNMFHGEPDASYLGGQSLDRLRRAELDATAAALRSAERPSARLGVESVDEAALGRLIMTFEVATRVAGSLYGVNTFDQPGVEAGKRFACGLMGRTGYESHGSELARLMSRAGTHKAEL